jgi:hypothetical protein
VSETRPGEIVLVPSRTRRRLLGIGAAACAALAVVLMAAATAATLAAAAACALCAGWAIFLALRAEPAVRVRPDVPLRALSASRMRIVLFAAQRRVVVWHDATDAATYRRLAVLARWQPRGQIR